MSVLAVTASLMGSGVQSLAQEGVGARATTIPATLPGLEWRHIGPAAFGGRIASLAVHPSDPSTIYVGAASGGVFKSTNNGASWTPVFDQSGGAQSIGALAIARSDPQVIWVGTGEPNNRQSSSWGNGVFVSRDGGATWQDAGLHETHHIGRIVVHPTDPRTAWVAALGHLWGPNEERGVYRTSDGGRSWTRVLAIDANTGAVDLNLDPDGRTLIAATYQRRRRAFGFVGGGTGSGLHRSTDGGTTWQRLTKGLPTGAMGRIGLAQAASNPSVVYAVVEHTTAGGVYRSSDRGVSWQRVNPSNPRPMYYSKLRVDPRDADHLWMLDAYLFESRDGGKTLKSDSTGLGIHTDHHALWISPADSRHMLLGNDGGLYRTYDGARTWQLIDNIPIGQFYDVAVDDRTPYRIYGGTQDNGTWALPSRTWNQGGIFNADVLHLAYGDGFQANPDPSNARYVFANSQNGRAYVVDTETREQRLIRPAPDNKDEVYQFGWNTPALVSPHDPQLYYYGGNRLFRTRNRGNSWEVVSPDLSRRQEWQRLPIMGTVRDSTTLSRDDGVSDYGVLTTISESPRRRGLLIVGTDDGLVHLSRDEGSTWRDITAALGMVERPWISRVLASRHDERVMYVALDAHQDDDFAPYLFRSQDAGETWRRIDAGIPSGYVINAIAEHPLTPDVLLVGTEFGLVVSYDRGASWQQPGGNLPRVPIDDIVVHERTLDIVLGTHGRSFILLDDARLMAGGDPARVTVPTLHTPAPAFMTYMVKPMPSIGGARYAGDNAAAGALLTYVMPAAARADSVRLVIRNAAGEVVRELEGSGSAGVHRIVWDLRYALPITPVASDAVWFGVPVGAWVLPGDYQITLRTPAGESSAPLVVRADPRASAALADVEARHTAGVRVHALLTQWRDADSRLTARARILGADTTTARGAEYRRLRNVFRSGWLSLKSRIIDLHGAVQGSTTAPTEGQRRVLDALEEEMRAAIRELGAEVALAPRSSRLMILTASYPSPPPASNVHVARYSDDNGDTPDHTRPHPTTPDHTRLHARALG
ncbi:MAG: hypothetical protein ABI910_03585 [Gemmatimonadota bacterium]